MYTQTVLIALLAAVAEARFSQEQGNGAISAIGALTDLGTSGQAATLAGNSIQFLLAAANPCGKLTQADAIITQLGTSDRAVAAARGLVAAEQNFNPFVVSVPSICSDVTLPKSAELRGVVPLIDPAVTGSDLENANSKTSITTPFDATGLSVAQVMVAQGFSNFTAVAVDGTKVAAAAGAAAPAASSAAAVSSVAAVTDAPAATSAAAAAASCPPATTIVTVTMTAGSAASSAASSAVVSSAAAAATTAAAASAAGTDGGAAGVAPAFVKSSLGLDFGTCVPTLKFEAGLNGRKETEFTFQAQDPVVNKGQQEALNPAIIMNRICDQLTNVCGAADDAKAACQAAKLKLGGGTRDVTTADAWNTELGFAGTETNPDGAPKTGLVGHA